MAKYQFTASDRRAGGAATASKGREFLSEIARRAHRRTDTSDIDGEATPIASSRRRNRPFIGGTVSPEVAAAIEAEAERLGVPRAHVIDARLRAAYGLPP